MIAELERADVPRGFEVWPANMPIVDAFLAAATQWRTAALADGRVLWLGLDYTAVRVALETLQLALTPPQWRGLVAMERAAANALNGSAG